MGAKTGIAWTDHTWSPWIGCTEISTAKTGGGGCDNCYARELDKRHRWGGATHWGSGVPRYRTKSWHLPVAWDKKAAALRRKERIFPSLCDPFDNEVPDEWRGDLWRLIRATPNLSWLLVTKRIGNVARMWPGGDYQNVRLLITVCNQEEADRDIPKLLALPCKNGISYEPALDLVDWRNWLQIDRLAGKSEWECSGFKPELNWIICGGESTQGAGKARPFDLAWARSTIAQCKVAGVPVFVKQLGSEPQEIAYPPHVTDAEQKRWATGGWTKIWEGDKSHWRRYWKYKTSGAATNPAEWPEDLRVQEFPA